MNTAKSLLALSRYQAKKESDEEEIRKLKALIKKQDALLKKVLKKVFEKHIEDLKSAYVSQDPPYILPCTKGEKENGK